MKLKMNQSICGFTVLRERQAAEIGATVYEFTHDKTGARLLFLDREDKNMTFAISFATLPEDDTGVFHIIEHSVLCGSEKFPLRDPFAELLKGSLNTFLNAMTYEDRTVYPVSSGCMRDFMNLTDVYLDAVFRPNFKTNPAIFRQEGWHLEYDGEKKALSRTGVVYNEMKGAYSSPDEAGNTALLKALFKGTPYGYDSGGDPDAIPELTYERFLSLYDKYYHPSNALLILDGSVDLCPTLELIDSHLSRFEKRDISVEYKKSEAVRLPLERIYYEVSEEEDDGQQARLLLGYVFSDSESSGKVERLAAAVLCDYLAGSNAAPLKRALLDSGLCRDVGMYVSKSYEQTVIIELRDMAPSAIEPAAALVEKALCEVIDGGIDKNRLTAILNSIEFSTRERDFGSFPKGVSFALSMLGVWHYGQNPEEALLFNGALAEIRELIKSDYFEQTLRKMTLDCPHTAAVAMIPDSTLSERRAKEQENELAQLLDGMSPAELQQVIEEDDRLKAWQSTEESEEARASLPTLSISDIDPCYKRVDKREKTIDGARTLSVDVKTDGIIYAYLFFNASDLTEEELGDLGLLTKMLKELGTDRSTPLELQSRIRAELGNLSFSFIGTERKGVATPYLRVGASVLEANKGVLTDILEEILLHTDFSDVAAIEEMCRQEKSAFADDVIEAGHSAAIARVEAFSAPGGALAEYTQGFEAYNRLCALIKVGDFGALSKRLATLLKRLTTRNRMTVAVAGEREESFIADTVARFPAGEDFTARHIPPLGHCREFIKIPTKVAYAVTGAQTEDARELRGALRVARSILSYEHLWTAVRVGGGAYGAGFVARKNGMSAFYSFRDPSPKRSLGCFADSANYLRKLADSGADITKFIIGAYGEYDIITTPKTLAALSVADFLLGWTEEQEQQLRADLLATTPEQLRRVADVIDRTLDCNSVCIVGGAEHLAQFEGDFDRVLTL